MPKCIINFIVPYGYFPLFSFPTRSSVTNQNSWQYSTKGTPHKFFLKIEPKVTQQEFLLFLKRKEQREPFSLVPFEHITLVLQSQKPNLLPKIKCIMLLKKLYCMYYNSKPKSALKGGHCSVVSPHIVTLESNNLQIKRR